MTFLARESVSIDSGICFKHQIKNGRARKELSYGIASFLFLESLPTVEGGPCGFLVTAHCGRRSWANRPSLRSRCSPSPRRRLCPASEMRLTFPTSEEQDLVQLHVFLKARDFWVSTRHSFLNRLLGSWQDSSRVKST